MSLCWIPKSLLDVMKKMSFVKPRVCCKGWFWSDAVRKRFTGHHSLSGQGCEKNNSSDSASPQHQIRNLLPTSMPSVLCRMQSV
jgi:hypothetical protein